MVAQAFTQGTMYGIAPVLTTNATLIGNVMAMDGALHYSRTAIETTHSASTGGWATYIAGDIKKPGELKITVQYDTTLDYKTLFAAGCDTITITFPKRGLTCGAALATTAGTFASAVVFVDLSAKWEFDSQAVITITFQLSGASTFVGPIV